MDQQVIYKLIRYFLNTEHSDQLIQGLKKRGITDIRIMVEKSQRPGHLYDEINKRYYKRQKVIAMGKKDGTVILIFPDTPANPMVQLPVASLN